MALLDVNDLYVRYPTPQGGAVEAVSGISFSIESGECFGLVGESGSGKSQTFLSILGLAGKRAQVGGSAAFDGQELIGAPQKTLNALRGNRLSLIFQDSITGLTPHMRIGDQMTEVLRVHKGLSARDAFGESLKVLEVVQIPEAQSRMKAYPHELSGGMRQRVMIAMALLCQPALIIADEPTTALDVTIQANILRALKKLKEHTQTALAIITHDLGVVAGICDRVAVMYAGRIVETAPVDTLFANPQHPYTQGLLGCMPRLGGARDDDMTVIPGRPPDLAQLPQGCAFAPRCVHKEARCDQARPALRAIDDQRAAACFRLEGAA
jgi:oligopeptide transport system ATP-binding protein